MHCEAWNTLFLRANGEFNCSCGPGENYTIFKDTPNSSAPVNIVDNVINGAYVGIRQKLKDGLIPFPDTCPKCELFSQKKFEGSIYTNSIRGFQVEASFQCNLNCSVCIPRNVRNKFPGPHDLSLKYFKEVIKNLYERNIKVKSVNFCGKGEPFMNSQLPDMVRIVRDNLDTVTTVSTNANVAWKDDFVNCGFDTMVFSIDGAFPSSYRQYRDGDWNLAIKNLKRASQLAGPDQKIVWKYILFSHNDSTNELLTAKKIADEIGVTLQFNFTIAPNPSLRFTNEKELGKFWEAPEQYPKSPSYQPFSKESLTRIEACNKNGVYIFGAAGIGMEIKKFLESRGIPIAGWIESASHKQGEKMDGIIIYSPDELKNLDVTAIVIGSKSSEDEMKKMVENISAPVFEIDGRYC